MSQVDIGFAEALNDAVVVAGSDGRIVYVNRALSSLLGWEARDLVGQAAAVLVPPRLRSAHLAGISRFFATGHGRIIGVPTRVPALTASGQERQVELLLSSLEGFADELLVVATLRDLGDRLDLERQTALAHELLGVMAESADDEAPAMRILATLAEGLSLAAAALWQPVHGEATLVCTAFWQDPDVPRHRLRDDSGHLRLGPGQGLPGRVWASGTATWIADVESDQGVVRRPAALADGMRSALAFPLRAGGRTVGVIELFSERAAESDDALLRTITTIGDRLGDFLQHRHAELEQRRLSERERAVAASLQRSLLPSEVPDVPWADLAVRFHPGGEAIVGGDFYDVFAIRSNDPTDASRWGVAVGDVCGTGPEAAAVTAHVRYAAQVLARSGRPPAEVLAEVNSALLERTSGEDRFCSCVFGVLTTSERGAVLQLSSAGHPRPLVRRGDGTIEEIDAPGMLLGVFSDVVFTQRTVDLAPGDVVLCYTDGVTEARAAGAQFGDERLAEVLAAAGEPPASADEVAAAVATAVRDFAGGDSGDDVAILVIRIPEPLQGSDGVATAGARRRV